MQLKLIIFDFDGVIADSVGIKRDAFAYVFREENQETIDWIQELDDRFPEKSRYEKFEIMYDEKLQRILTPEKRALHGRDFSDYCFQKIIECPYISGVLEFLNNPEPPDVAMAIASATPEPELQQIARAKKIDHFFRHIMGSPRKKPEIIQDILARENVARESAVFVGDAMSDYRAAVASGVAFVGRAEAGRASEFEGLPGCLGTVPDFNVFHARLRAGL